jgi:Exopolysaccharide biosynthesis protein YbjH
MLDRFPRFLLAVFFSLIFSSYMPAEDSIASKIETPENAISYDDGESSLMEDLLIVNYWNQRLNEKFPISYNHLLQGGYFSMPSARMGKEGEIGIGYGYVPPYILYNARFQLVNFLEISGNYRIFKGVADPVLTRAGFGDFSDKGANLKLSLFSAEESRYQLPGLAIGLEDFIGTKAFRACYVVLTKVFLKQNLEITLGFVNGLEV